MRVPQDRSTITRRTAASRQDTEEAFPGVPFIRPFLIGMGGMRAMWAHNLGPTTRPGGIYLAPIPTVGLAAKYPP